MADEARTIGVAGVPDDRIDRRQVERGRQSRVLDGLHLAAHRRRHALGRLHRPDLGRGDEHVRLIVEAGEQATEAGGLVAALVGQRPLGVGARPLLGIARVRVAQELKLRHVVRIGG